jgi:hypothetical protein
MTKIIKKVGLWTFIVGFIVFVFTLSLSDYRLTTEIIEEQGNGEKFEVLQQASQSMLGNQYNTNISFISDLRASFEQANQTIIDKYALPENLAEDIASKAQSGEQYNFRGSLIDEVITGDDEISKYQKAHLSEYTGWLEDRSFDSGENLTSQLHDAINSYNNSLSYQKAFDSYTTDNLVFWITKNASLGVLKGNLKLWFLLSFGLMLVGAFTYFYGNYKNTQPGIKNNHIYHDPMTNIGWLGIVTGIFLIAFYVVLYFYPEYLTNWVLLVDPVSKWLNGGPASHWFLYGFMYTLAILVMGVRMLLKYRHSKHQIWRTVSVMFFQTAFAFIIPEILAALNKPSYDFKNIWPLDYDFFYSYNLNELMASGLLGWFMLFWGIALIILAVPVITYFYGKRWYCSWVCGCGGLAETLGDPYRHLSDKSLKAWKIERWMVHSVLVFAVLNTGAVLYTFFSGSYSIFAQFPDRRPTGSQTGTIPGCP